MRIGRVARRERAAVGLGAIGAVLAAAAFRAVPHQWTDACAGRFGAAHGLLVGSVLFGLIALVLGAGSDDEYDSGRSLVGLLAGLVALLTAGIVFALLSTRGCGD